MEVDSLQCQAEDLTHKDSNNQDKISQYSMVSLEYNIKTCNNSDLHNEAKRFDSHILLKLTHYK